MPSFETIKKYARCYSDARLQERAKLWPDPLTWEWFLGERCEAYDRAACVEFLSIAVAFIKAENVLLPMPVRELWIARTVAQKPVLLDALATLGIYLDRWEAGEREMGPTRSDAYIELTEALNVYTNRA